MNDDMLSKEFSYVGGVRGCVAAESRSVGEQALDRPDVRDGRFVVKRVIVP